MLLFLVYNLTKILKMSGIPSILPLQDFFHSPVNMNTQIKRIPNANTISSVSEKFRIFQYVMDYKSVY